LLTAFLTGIAVIDTSGVGCPTAMLIIGIAYIVAAAVIMLLRVYRRPLDNLLTAVANVAFAAVCILKGIAPSHADVAAAIQIVQSACLFLKVLYSLYVWLRERPLLRLEADDEHNKSLRGTPRFGDDEDDVLNNRNNTRGTAVAFAHTQLDQEDAMELAAMQAPADPVHMTTSFSDGRAASPANYQQHRQELSQAMTTSPMVGAAQLSPPPLLPQVQSTDDLDDVDL
ncbi:membrane-associated protein, putative, partial [Bodo saltans]